MKKFFAYALFLFACWTPATRANSTNWTEMTAFGRTFMCNNPDHILYKFNVMTLSGFGHIWTRETAFQLAHGKQVTIDADVRLGLDPEKGGGEFILLFAKEKTPADWEFWDGSDDLQIRIGCDQREGDFQTVIRTAKGGQVIAQSPYYIRSDRWTKIQVVLNSSRLIAYVNGKEIIQTNLASFALVESGPIGLLGYREVPVEIRSFVIKND
jgi:hypothetical protein